MFTDVAYIYTVIAVSVLLVCVLLGL